VGQCNVGWEGEGLRKFTTKNAEIAKKREFFSWWEQMELSGMGA